MKTLQKIILPIAAIAFMAVASSAQAQAILWDNGDTDGSNGYSNGTFDALGVRRTLLDDFEVPEGDTWEVTDFHWLHINDAGGAGTGTGVELFFRADNANTPGDVIATANITAYVEENTGREWFVRQEILSSADFDPIVLGPGRYWIEWTVVGALANDFVMVKQAFLLEECFTNYEDFPPLGPCSVAFGVLSDLSWNLTGNEGGGGDSDGDGVPDGEDFCPDTTWPDRSPTSGTLGLRRYTLVSPPVFDVTPGRFPPPEYTIFDTNGCSCDQLLAGEGVAPPAGRVFLQVRRGCSRQTMANQQPTDE